MARGELHCLGATPLDEYRQYIEKDPALARRFQPVYVDEPTVDDTISILRGLKEKYEGHHGVRISDSALVAAVRLSNRYITDRFLPDKAIDLIDEAAARVRIEVASKPDALDEIDRHLMQLKIEQQALKKEKDEESKKRLGELEKIIAETQEKSDKMTADWRAEQEKCVVCRMRWRHWTRPKPKLPLQCVMATMKKRPHCNMGKFQNWNRPLKK